MPTLTGTWRFNETLNWPSEYGNRNFDLGFNCSGFGYTQVTCIELNFKYYTDGDYFSMSYWVIPFGTTHAELAYDSRTGWVDEAVRTIELIGTQEMSDEFYEWLIANAVPVVTAPQLNPAALI